MLYGSEVAIHARIQEFSSGGVQVSLTKKALTFFWVFFFVLSLFYQSQMVNFKEIFHFSRFKRGSNIFQGGSNFFQRGSNCLFPIEAHITCDFPGGGVRTPSPPPPPPSGSALAIKMNLLMRAATDQTNLRKSTVLPEPFLFAHTVFMRA